MADYYKNHPKNRINQSNNKNHLEEDIYGKDHQDEEFATDWDTADVRETEDFRVETKQLSGWIAIVLSVLSFFFWPVVLGIAGIIVGIVARTRNAEWLGNVAIVAGAVSLLLALVVRPFIF